MGGKPFLQGVEHLLDRNVGLAECHPVGTIKFRLPVAVRVLQALVEDVPINTFGPVDASVSRTMASLAPEAYSTVLTSIVAADIATASLPSGTTTVYTALPS